MNKAIIIILLLLLFSSCTMHHYVHHETVCDTIEVVQVDTLIQWEPVLTVDTSRIYGDTLQRVWMQWEEGGEWHQYLLKNQER
jgi:hypothetical protein